ncbi:MAG TPA: nucleoside-diphosphate sugar epimerase/dehydratase [Bacteroidia bacterium]|jgi:FlaA1/EpsC-like NDP-sugar epimerase|nr:nucleoside-diphosphate sugar epimerase/dehydratase [Bacteroidia bacterium]
MNTNIIRSFLPRWSILLIDVFLCFCSLILAYLLRFNFVIPLSERVTFIYVFPFVLICRGLSFYVTGLYRNIIRYMGSKDVVQIVLILSTVSAFFALSNVVFYFTPFKRFIVPYSIIIIECFSSAFILIAVRMIYKGIYAEATSTSSKNRRSIIIYGANDAGLITKRAVDRDAGTKYEVLAFLDEDERNWGKRLEGVTIYSPDRLHDLLENNNVAHLVLSTSDISYERKNEITDTCLTFNTKVLNVPPINHWINGELSFKQIKKVKIEDLLERDPIVLDKDKIESQLKGKTVLITGAAGSIGSEIVRQIIPYKPEKLVLVDQAESAIYDLQLEMNEGIRDKEQGVSKDMSLTPYSLPLIKVYLADICNQSRMESIFKETKPQIVFHAAAYKHVPVMEENPVEAINVNILGTRVLADLSVKYGVDTFVMISTDKAINPTGVMGASKRIAEIYVQSLNATQKTKFITTRFGNVLGSNGSVIPRFRQQIEKGGPVTITHPDITRFFMTIPESCQLVLEAGAIGNGGEVFIFDMGKSVKVLDLAKKMIQLSGLTLDKDIKIIFSGLRPGEKLYEELLHTSENTLPTHHPLILIAKVREYDFNTISAYIDELAKLASGKNDMTIVGKMKEIVPEYISNNSVFAELDKKA